MRRPLAAILLCGLLAVLILLLWPARPAAVEVDPSSSPASARETASVSAPSVTADPDATTAPADASAKQATEMATPSVDPLLQSAIAPGEALRLLQWCGDLASASAPAAFERDWQWLGADAAKLERARFRDARSWAVVRCGPWVIPPDSDRAQTLRAQFAERSRRSPELQDQLRAIAADSVPVTAPDDPRIAQARQLLQSALAAGRPELLRDAGRLLESSNMASPDWLGPYAGGGAGTLFTLLACDLGMPCGEGSDIVQMNCALRGRCGYADYQTLAFDAFLGARQAELVRQHRQLLLARIRAGQVAGLFDPLPAAPPPPP